MKKLLIAVILLLSSFIYVVVRVTQSTLRLNKISVNADNPVSFHWNNIGIDTGFIKNSPDSIYFISMLPVYLLVLIALFLTVLAFRREKQNKNPK
jgi:uncharacterized membrane protein